MSEPSKIAELQIEENTTTKYKPTKKGIKFGVEEHAEFDETDLVKIGDRKIPELSDKNSVTVEHLKFINHEREQAKGVGFNLKADINDNSETLDILNQKVQNHTTSSSTSNNINTKSSLSTNVQPKQRVIPQRNLSPEQLLKLEQSDSDFLDLKSELLNNLKNAQNSTRKSPKCDITGKNLHKMQYENLVNFFKDKNFEHISELTLSRNYLMSPLPNRLISAFPNTTRLFINENQLVEMPNEVLELKRLWYLDARSNKLQDLPDEMFDVKHSSLCNTLIHLHLRSNRLANLTPKIGCLKALTNLTLRSNRLTSLPDSIGTLSGLIQLDISYNKIDVLPESLKLCKNLEMLLMEQNALSVLPDDLFKDMTKLMKIGMKHNNLKTLPMSLVNTCIDVLNVESNRLTSIPNGILGKLKLISINLNRNHFKKVPLNDGPFQWPQLQNFSMDNNELECIDLATFSNAPQLHAVNIRNNHLNCLQTNQKSTKLNFILLMWIILF